MNTSRLRSIRKIGVDDKWENEDPTCVYEISTGGCGCCSNRDEVPVSTAIYKVKKEIAFWQKTLDELMVEWKESPPLPGESKEDCAHRKGAIAFDCALPQPWLDMVVDALHPSEPVGSDGRNRDYDMILSGTVWCYDRNRTFGSPFFLTNEAEHLVRIAELNADKVFTL